MALRLTGTVISPDAVTRTQRARMFVLMAEHYENVTPHAFERDLSEKQWVVMLRDTATWELQGFSTLMRLTAVVQGIEIAAFFSGDTVVHREYWGEPELATVWGNFVLSQARSSDSERHYWFLISKGFRTYRYLPLYFKEFFPRRDVETPPFERLVMEQLASGKFPDDYQPGADVIRFDRPKDRLRADLAEIAPLRLNQPDVRFFVERNPGYAEGDELICLAELTPENLTPAAQRVRRRALQVSAPGHLPCTL